MRTIKYKEKITSANTIYVDIDRVDYHWLRDQMRKINDILDLIEQAPDLRSGKEIDEFFCVNKDLPRRAQKPYGLNSVRTLVAGIVDNMANGTQRDFSLVTLPGIAYAINLANQTFDSFDSVEFVDKNNPPVPTGPSPFEQLFEWDTCEITVTIRKKNGQKK